MRREPDAPSRRLDDQPAAVELQHLAPAAGSSGSVLGPDARRILAAIEDLPEGEREAFGLIRIHGLTRAEAAEVLGVSCKTVRRRLNRGCSCSRSDSTTCAPVGSRRACSRRAEARR